MVKHGSIREDFARELRAAREAKGWSRAKLARAMGVGEGTIMKWERADNAPGFECFLFLSVLFDWPHVMLDEKPRTLATSA